MPPTLLRRVLPVSLEPAGLSRAASWAGIASEVVAGANTRIPLSLILGLIYAESRGYPNAKSGPVTDWFSSFGLMQVRGEPWVARGHTIPELFDARVNIAEGLRIFEEKLAAKGGDVAAAVSAYNGGGRRYPAGTRFCQVWREGTPATGRDIDRDCQTAYVTGPNEFGNQPYVDEVLAAASVIETMVPRVGGPLTPEITTAGVVPPSSALAAAIAIGLLAWLGFARLFR